MRRLTTEQFNADRGAVSDALWKHAEAQADAAQAACSPTEDPAEVRRRAFNVARAAGWDRFARFCDHVEWLQARIADLELKR